MVAGRPAKEQALRRSQGAGCIGKGPRWQKRSRKTRGAAALNGTVRQGRRWSGLAFKERTGDESGVSDVTWCWEQPHRAEVRTDGFGLRPAGGRWLQVEIQLWESTEARLCTSGRARCKDTSTRASRRPCRVGLQPGESVRGASSVTRLAPPGGRNSPMGEWVREKVDTQTWRMTSYPQLDGELCECC